MRLQTPARPPHRPSDAPSSREVSEAVQAASLQFAFGGLPMSLIVSVALAGMTAFTLRASGTFPVVIGWFACLASVNALRLLNYRRFRAQSSVAAQDLNTFERQLLTGCLAGGISWGCAPVLFLPHAPELQFFLAFVIAGVSSGAVTSLSVTPLAAYAFVIPCIGPLAVRFFLAGDTLHVLMGAMTCFYLGVMVLVARRGHLQLERMVTSQLDAQRSRAALNTSESQRRSSDERLRVAADASQIGVWELDVKTNHVFWDERMHQIYRVADTLAIADYRDVWRRRVHPGDLARVETDLTATVVAGAPFRSDFRILWPNGEERHIKAAADVQRAPDGAVARLVGINLDVTEFKRLERVKGEFVSTVSHELRTPLTSIRGALGLVLKDSAGVIPEGAKSLLRVGVRNAERLGALIEALLDVQQLDNGKLQFDLREHPLRALMVRALEANMPFAAQHHVRLELSDSPQTNVMVRVNEERISQVMTHLLSNAVKFSPPDTCVTVSLGRGTANHVRVSVHDQGPGISPEFRSKIFTLFTQADPSDSRSQGGAGLGLAISKALIERMGGRIGFESNPTGGTIFFFELPAGRPDDASHHPIHARTASE